jgi:23S rRNA (cytidine1920-2'-O)/16S rRNA (cytidine1409-2'-O)-methyltransferase
VARRRLDAELVRRELTTSRTEAQAPDRREPGARQRLDRRQGRAPGRARDALVIDGPPARFVGRGAEKLEHALTEFGRRRHRSASARRRCLDRWVHRLPAATGRVHVVALDVGHGQLHERLRADPIG